MAVMGKKRIWLGLTIPTMPSGYTYPSDLEYGLKASENGGLAD